VPSETETRVSPSPLSITSSRARPALVHRRCNWRWGGNQSGPGTPWAPDTPSMRQMAKTQGWIPVFLSSSFSADCLLTLPWASGNREGPVTPAYCREVLCHGYVGKRIEKTWTTPSLTLNMLHFQAAFTVEVKWIKGALWDISEDHWQKCNIRTITMCSVVCKELTQWTVMFLLP